MTSIGHSSVKRPSYDVPFLFITRRRFAIFLPSHSSDRSRSRGGTFSIAAKILAIEHPRHGIPHTRHSSHSPAPCRPFHVVCYHGSRLFFLHETAEMIESRERAGGRGAIEGPEDSTWHSVSCARARHLAGLFLRCTSCRSR